MPSWYRDPTAPTPTRPRRIGVVAFIERDGALLERRADFGTWGIPGGALDEDETVSDGLAQEVREETGLEVVSTELLELRFVRFPQVRDLELGAAPVRVVDAFLGGQRGSVVE